MLKIYGILKFTPEEAKQTINELGMLQQMAAGAEIINDLDKKEAALLAGIDPKAEKEIAAAMEKFMTVRKTKPDFAARIAAAAKKVITEHTDYLKTRGDAAQKAEIAKILAGAGI